MWRATSLGGGLILFLALATPSLAAQCRPVPGTGCNNSAPPICTGSTGVGQTFGVVFIGGNWWLLLGLCARTPIPLPFSCSGVCNLGVDPSIHTLYSVHSTWSVQIPNDPRLIGATFCHQAAERFSSCVFAMTQTIRFTITP